MYIRTKKVLKKNQRKPKRFRNRKVRVNQRVVLNDRKCPSCGGTEVRQWAKGKKISGYSTRHKQAFDLVFTSSGIKRAEVSHPLRDMNQELLNNPYDQELQLITGPFGTLLREIVETIDQHGLKRRYLEKHMKAVAKYFESLATQTFRSEAAEALRERLVKYREKLFTFIQHDGVPWNNNNAENAIRQFAYYREDTTRTLTEVGLTDHLVLLSICQTCRYKEVSFLKFLLSKEQDIDAFCEGQRRKRRSSTIETYPKGVLRPDFRRPIKTAAEQKPLDNQ